MDKSLISLHVSAGPPRGALLVLPAAGLAQAPPAPAGPAGARRLRRVTLDEALQLAEAGSETVAAAEAGVRRADGQIALARSALFPQLTSSLGYQRTLQTQFDGIFDSDCHGTALRGPHGQPGRPARGARRPNSSATCSARRRTRSPAAATATCRSAS